MDSYSYFDFDASPRRHHGHGPHHDGLDHHGPRHGPQHHGPERYGPHHGPHGRFPMHPFDFRAPDFAPFGGPDGRGPPRHRHHFDDSAEFYGRHGPQGGFHFGRHGSPFDFPRRHCHGRHEKPEREPSSDSTSSDSSSDSEVEHMRRWGRKHGRRFGQVGPFGYGRRHHGMRQRSRKPEEDTTDFDIVKDVNELSLADSAPKPKKFKFVVKARGYAENDIKVTREKDEIVIEGRREKTTDDGTFSTTINHRIRVPEGIDADSELKTKLTRGHLFVVLKKPKTAAAPEEIVIDN